MRLAALLVLCTACVDLPEGWDDATPIEMTQSPCKGSVLGSSENEGLQTTLEEGLVELTYVDAHFRCDQEVEGFVRRGEGTLDFLFQPVDLNPSAVARCDCKYDLATSFVIENDTRITVWRRWDSVVEPQLPVKIGERSLKR